MQADPKIFGKILMYFHVSEKIFCTFGSNAALRLIRDLLLTSSNQNSTLYLHLLNKCETIPICLTQVNYSSYCCYQAIEIIYWTDIHLGLFIQQLHSDTAGMTSA